MRLAPRQHLILGPPGCGKTTELLRRLEKHLEKGTSPERVAYFSFTRKAVEVARSRAIERFSLTAEDLPYFRTVHSMVFSLNGHTKAEVLQRQHYEEIGQALGISFSCTTHDETGLLVGQSEGDLHLFLDGLARSRRVPLYEQWHDALLPDLDFRAVERTVTAVTQYKQQNLLIDFTDMLEIYEREGIPLNIDVAFIDEAQDLSLLQWIVLRQLLQNCPIVYIAGDDDQAIYRWSGADVQSFLALEGTRHELRQSHRCPASVHRLAVQISTRIKSRFAKHWQPRAVAGEIMQLNALDGFDLTQLRGSTLLLARNVYLLAAYIGELRKRGLTYWTRLGMHSVAKSHARAIYAYTKLLKGRSISGIEVKQIYDQLRAGIGVKRGYKNLSNLANEQEYSEQELRTSHGLLAQGPWYDALDGISGNDRMYYRSVLQGGGNLLEDPAIQVNTIHGVKGGEADNVIVCPDMALRSFQQYARDSDDEHRVAYVAVSRARHHLYLLNPRTQNHYRYQ